MLIVEMKAEIAEAQRLMDLGEGDGSPLEGKVPSRFMRKIVCRLRLSEVSRQ